MESVSPELRNPRGAESEFTPVPSPRNLSALKMSSPAQPDTQEPSGRPDSHHHPDRPTTGALEGGQRNLPALLQEVDYLRQSNKKLREALMSKERDLETLTVEAQLLEQATEAKIAEKSAALVREVYSAQRERDDAVLARLRLANEERDEALLRVQHLQEYIRGMEDINPKESDMTLQELLDKLDEAEDGAEIVRNGDLVLEHIKRSQERREQITAEEMGAVIVERDTARAQCNVPMQDYNFTGCSPSYGEATAQSRMLILSCLYLETRRRFPLIIRECLNITPEQHVPLSDTKGTVFGLEGAVLFFVCSIRGEKFFSQQHCRSPHNETSVPKGKARNTFFQGPSKRPRHWRMSRQARFAHSVAPFIPSLRRFHGAPLELTLHWTILLS